MSSYSGYSKSNNACQAERYGRYPMTQAKRAMSKITGIPQNKCKELLELFHTGEWHHSSKFYNCINYYDILYTIAQIKIHILCQSDRFYNAKYNEIINILDKKLPNMLEYLENIQVDIDAEEIIAKQQDSIIKSIHNALGDFNWIY